MAVLAAVSNLHADPGPLHRARGSSPPSPARIHSTSTASSPSGFFLLALISLSLFPTIKRSLPDRPDLQERLVKALLIPLAIADVSRTPFTMPKLTLAAFAVGDM